jgi:hypothetical protein
MSAVNTMGLSIIQEMGKVGRTILSTKYPSDFEMYIMSLELTDSEGRTIDYFSFPVMPQQITKTENKKVNIKKSASGVTVLISDSFTPSDLVIKGNFGRSFKLLLKPNVSSEEGYGFKGFFGNTHVEKAKLDSGIKTGFGCIKILQDIIDKSIQLDSKGRPNRLYLYNMALSESYLVSITPQGFNLSQTYDSNMIWNYSLSLSILAPLEAIIHPSTATAVTELMKASIIQNSANQLASDLISILKLP